MWKCHKLVFAAECIFCNNTKSNWKNPTRLSVERIRAMLTTRLACNNTSSLLPSIGTHTSKRINKCADKTHTAHITRKTSRVKIKNMNRPFKTGFLLPHHTVSNCGDIMNKMPLLWWSTPTAEAEKHHMTRSSKAKTSNSERKPDFLHPQLSSPHVFLAARPESYVRRTTHPHRPAPLWTQPQCSHVLFPVRHLLGSQRGCMLIPSAFSLCSSVFSFLPLSPRLSLPPPPPHLPLSHWSSLTEKV